MTDRCPGVLRLHEAADGGLARVRLPGGRLSAQAMRALADAADHGNGIIELTSRASLQIRGLSPASAELCAALLGGAGLLPSRAHERVRNIIASPFAAPAIDRTVEALDRAVCADPLLAGLSARFLFAVEDGTGLHGRAADVTIAPGQVADALAAAHASLASAPAGARIVPAPDVPPAPGRPTFPGSIEPVQPGLGVRELADGRMAVTVLPPLARLRPEQLRELAELTGELRIAVGKTLTAFDAAPAELRALGLIDDPNSGWVGLTACAGEGACNNATYPVRELAAARAKVRGHAGRAPQPEHWAGCARNCGLPQGARLVNDASVAALLHEADR